MDRFLDYLTLIKEYAKDYALENTGLKVLAILITAVLWWSVASRPVSQIAIHNVPIELRNLPDSLVITLSNDTTLAAKVNLRGPRDVLDSLRSGDLALIGDLSGVDAGVRVVFLALDKTRLPASVEERGIEPRSIRVTVERVVEREVVIKPRFEGSLPEGYELLGWHITPSSVRIEGAASAVNSIEGVSTETVSLSDKTATFSEEVAIDMGSPNINLEDERTRTVMLTVNIGEIRKERVFDRVPVTLTGAPPSAQPVPKFVKVTVFGARSAVDALTPEALSVVLDANGNGSPQVAITNEDASRVTVLSVEPKTIRIR
ncbi:MAG TPA: CdaR family protein [Blastocatellia bacterium]|nr:CdaR family protein [Blastocatellia bacterium]